MTDVVTVMRAGAGVLVCMALFLLAVWRIRRTRTPAAAAALLEHRVSQTTVHIPTVPARDERGATEEWSPLAEVASVGAGNLLPAGVPTVSVDDVAEDDVLAAQIAAEMRALDDRLEEARRKVNAAMIEAFGGEMVDILNTLAARDIAAQAWAEESTTGPIPLKPARPARLTPAQARRARKRARRQLAAVGA